ncbi:MAG: Asp-tRNA(Asn)/Glu-tRNA(Gln) amidotransferase subunit GatA [Chlamydiales bacterium]|nr:Asp-tRNA(Asn)/Glu-tRNA(Gln) amidotransferase subunit GatA [Chlamydiales bacterium]
MYKLTALELHKQFLEKRLSAEEITRYYLQRIEAFDGQVGAFLSVFHERALKKARALDEKLAKGESVGKLAGVPIGVKDNIHVKGELTTCASKFLANYRAVFDATATRLVEEEDAIILGKLNLDEFAMGSSTENSALKETCNPWNLSCVAGGSSGGSTAAVAARLCPISFGSDTGGSVRQPAALCGVLGFKPTYGRVSRYGLVAFASSLDQIGPIAFSSEDIGMVMEVIGQNDPKDATTFPGRPEDYLSVMDANLNKKRIGVPWAFLEDLHSEARELFLESVDVLKDLGCEIIDIDLNILKYSVATYYIIATAEASTNLARFDGIRYGVRSPRAETLDQVYDYSRTEGFGSEVKKRIFLGTYVLSAGYQDDYYKQATKVRVKIIDAFNHAFEKCDAIATPVSPIAAFPKKTIRDPLQMYLQDIYTIGVNLARLPAVSVPCGFNAEKKPFGLQFIGPKHSDVLVCRMAHAYEKAAPYSQEIPANFDREVS